MAERELALLAPAAGLLALAVAVSLARSVARVEAGEGKMVEVARAIQEGAMAFLAREYGTLVAFVLAMAAVLTAADRGTRAAGFGPAVAAAYLMGATASLAAGYGGMRVATMANVRTARMAQGGGLPAALAVAFNGGAVMGLAVVGLGLLGLGGLYLAWVDPARPATLAVLNGFAMGASSVALFARVGGGIFTKAADMGADLVGKLEAGIPEDDPRNPAVIADNVGDNVGDVAGMGADLFESYVGSVVAAVVVGAAGVAATGAARAAVEFPLVLAAAGVVASLLGIAVTRAGAGGDPAAALRRGTLAASFLLAAGGGLAAGWLGLPRAAAAMAAGLVAGVIIGLVTEYYTSGDRPPVRQVERSAETGTATNILAGMAVGMKSTALPVLVVGAATLVAHHFAGLYGIAVAAVGMLATTGITVAVDAYGPIADNAGGIAEMAGLPAPVREVTDRLDAVGNTTAAMGKGFAIGSAALTALGLFSAYAATTGLGSVDLLDPRVITGALIGGMLPMLFSALAVEAVGRAAFAMIEEVRRQLRQRPGILTGEQRPDYARCVDISTRSALAQMMVPGLLAVAVPLAVGLLLGPEAVGGLLAGALVTGVLVAIFMANAGGAWDNAKKYIEGGALGGKGSEPHRAAVVGDTVGDPFKDTAGPSLNILIKLMSIVALVFAPLFVRVGG
ncbi:V-type H(+)-translocating pyrophosphatase [Thermaerobacter marianensis DSM 12885]|uniref:Putative K(+)-stimulated pyrophosphate-energized sodium pump n=1 Tax=Thermaerobacter marianensis (strain ATCC 700841 / DSM 12885 / JCM 10246 / 7p75a) TaxID=644966 RepID=E6SKU2_THEM7|nr:sodium-translocating pyrophosphatase [Thermaerobacter marianensis]ADU52315.1 V-type H(+)-translocating pyrophosphatase [Thermaerobacter marianensis DSM 12885]